MRVGLVGLGSIGMQHARALRTLASAEVIAFEPSEELRETASRAAVVDRATASLEELLTAGLDACIIASPDRFHPEQATAALATGAATLIEKPLAADYATAAAFARAITDDQRDRIMIGYVLRHRRVLTTARELLDSGAIGSVVGFQVMLGAYGTITAAQSRFDTPEANRLYRDYSHEYDYISWLFGEITAVTAVARTVQGPAHVESPNVVDALLETSRGIVGSLHIDYIEPIGTRCLRIVGSGGRLDIDVAAGTLSVRRPDERFARAYDLHETPATVLARQAQHLLDVAGGAPLAPSAQLDDGLRAMRVTEALIRAAASRQWVPTAEIR